MKVKELMKFLEATDPEVEVRVQIALKQPTLVCAYGKVVSVEDEEVGTIVIKGESYESITNRSESR